MTEARYLAMFFLVLYLPTLALHLTNDALLVLNFALQLIGHEVAVMRTTLKTNARVRRRLLDPPHNKPLVPLGHRKRSPASGDTAQCTRWTATNTMMPYSVTRKTGSASPRHAASHHF
jgi:hypothetical protein